MNMLSRAIQIVGSRLGQGTNAQNAIAGVASYAISPVLAVISAPVLLSGLGLPGFGLWGFVNSISGTLNFATSGLTDGVLSSVAVRRQSGHLEASASLVRVVRSALALHILFAMSITLLVIVAAPFAAQFIKGEGVPVAVARSSILLSGWLLGLRMVDAVFNAALRGLERYDITASVTVVVRVGSIGAASIVAILTASVPAVLISQIAVTAVGLFAHAWVCSRTIKSGLLIGVPERRLMAEIVAFGKFSWLRGMGGVFFSQADRLLVGALLGPATLGAYTLLTLLAQQGHALGGAAFHFVFPMSRRWPKRDMAKLRKVVARYQKWNLVGATVYGVLSLAIGPFLLTRLSDVAGPEALYASLALNLSWILLATSTLSYYLLLGLGQVRFVALTSLLAGLLTLLAIALLAPPLGLPGACAANGVFGLVMLANNRRERTTFASVESRID